MEPSGDEAKAGKVGRPAGVMGGSFVEAEAYREGKRNADTSGAEVKPGMIGMAPGLKDVKGCASVEAGVYQEMKVGKAPEPMDKDRTAYSVRPRASTEPWKSDVAEDEEDIELHPFIFDDFSELPAALDSPKEETVPSSPLCNVDSITRVDSPKRAVRAMTVDADDNETSPKRARVMEEIVLQSPVEGRIASAIRRGLSNLQKREAGLNKREATMNKREKSMDKRDATMDKRDVTMDKRESTIDKRESSMVGTLTADDGRDGETKETLSQKVKEVNDSGAEQTEGKSTVENADNNTTNVEEVIDSDAEKTVKEKATVEKADNNKLKVTEVIGSVHEKIVKGKSTVEKADNNAALVEKFLSIPTRTQEIGKLYNKNKTIVGDFFTEHNEVIAKNVKRIVGSLTGASLMNVVKGFIIEEAGLESEGSADAVVSKGSSDAVVTEGSADAVVTEGSADAVVTEGSADAVVTEGSADAVVTEASADAALGEEASGAVGVKKDEH